MQVTLGRSAFQILGGRSTVVSILLSERNQDLVERLGKVRVEAIVAARHRFGNKATVKRKLTLRARGGRAGARSPSLR